MRRLKVYLAPGGQDDSILLSPSKGQGFDSPACAIGYATPELLDLPALVKEGVGTAPAYAPIPLSQVLNEIRACLLRNAALSRLEMRERRLLLLGWGGSSGWLARKPFLSKGGKRL